MSSASTAQTGSYPVDNLRGALWMLGASVCFAVTGIVMKQMTAHIPAVQVSFARCVSGLIVLAPIIMNYGWSVYRTHNPGRHVVRIMFSTGANIFGIYAIATLPLALATSLGFTRPLFMILIAAAFLSEIVGWRRGIATVVGFAGVVITVGPTELSMSPGFFAALASAACLAATMAVVKVLARADSPATIMCWSTTGVCVMTALPALYVWVPPTPMEWVMMASTGITASCGQYMMIKAFTHGEATVMNPIDYSQIILTTIAGYFLFAEIPTLWTAAGTLVIVASTLYIVMRDAKLKQVRTPPPETLAPEAAVPESKTPPSL